MPKKRNRDIVVPEIPRPQQVTTFYGTEKDTLKMEEIFRKRKMRHGSTADANLHVTKKK